MYSPYTLWLPAAVKNEQQVLSIKFEEEGLDHDAPPASFLAALRKVENDLRRLARARVTNVGVGDVTFADR